MKLKSLNRSHIVMANEPGLEGRLRRLLHDDFQKGAVDFRVVRSMVSSPRLMSFSVQCFDHPGLAVAGESYLSMHTMIGDGSQKTYALSSEDWFGIRNVVEKVESCRPFDSAVMNIQVWPYPPSDLDDFAMAVAVALSFTPSELMAESRISLAVDELMANWGYCVDEF
ncbi:hypothetical protein [Pseudomonas taiwanensis]|uniref:hypothetical protein n=1 Tax=Pseudomonas taiwanensis TaxID=470150 RepID=UPI001648FB87|nr:hypothetical protein [Pseudomonas taiwanensis]MBC3489503.1 hypothetical protein [Pseudomonas taiwanensis]